ncbi:hypothetical protein [Pararhodonellum marinum]|uniref:hypothetical protein n=1 Tax=Pararhodonellum marinum TaxID=2755358 RepID=UPI00188E6A24|nr:hypothetical protein [Pararhodonellum marinum]
MKKNYILHPVFIICLLILISNDFYLKANFGNGLTGKLSDFAGLIVFSIFIAFLVPITKKWISLVTGILFIIWKTPFVTPFIEIFNKTFPFQIQRVVDYSDFWALLCLPIAHILLNKNNDINFNSSKILHLGKIAISSVSFFAICATSIIPPVEVPRGTVYIGKEYTIRKSKNEIIQMIESLGYNVDYFENLDEGKSIKTHRSRKIPYYQTDNIIIYDETLNPIDTVLNVKYTMYEPKENRTIIKIINVTLSEDGNIQRWQTLKYLRKEYKRMIEKQVIKKIK